MTFSSKTNGSSTTSFILALAINEITRSRASCEFAPQIVLENTEIPIDGFIYRPNKPLSRDQAGSLLTSFGYRCGANTIFTWFPNGATNLSETSLSGGSPAIPLSTVVLGFAALMMASQNNWIQAQFRNITKNPNPLPPINLTPNKTEPSGHKIPKPFPVDRPEQPQPTEIHPRRKAHCTNSESSKELTNQLGFLDSDIVNEFKIYQQNGRNNLSSYFRRGGVEYNSFLPKPVAFWLYSPSKQERIRVTIKHMPFDYINSRLTDKNDLNLTQLRNFRGHPLSKSIVLVAETDDCEILATLLGSLDQTSYLHPEDPDEVIYSHFFDAIRAFKFSPTGGTRSKEATPSSIDVNMINYAFFITILLEMNRLELTKESDMTLPIIVGYTDTLVDRIRKLIGITKSYVRTHNKNWLEVSDISDLEARDMINKLPGRQIPNYPPN